MSPLISFVASYAINSVWAVPLVGGAGWVVSRLVKRVGAEAQHVSWVAALALAVLAPLLPLGRFLAGAYVSAGGHGHSSIAITAAAGDAPRADGFATLPAVVVYAVVFLYLGGLLYFAARLGWSMYWTARLLRKARPFSLERESEELWQRCRRIFSVGDARILSSRRIDGPVTMGWREPVLLVPDAFSERCRQDDLLAALAHECAHMRRRDFQKNLIYEVASLLIAFHPVTWMLKLQIAQTREMVCDGIAVRKLIDPRSYTQSLLRLAMLISSSRVSTLHAIGIFDANILERRIMMITTKKPKLSVAVKYGLIVAGGLLLLSAATLGAAKTVVFQPGMQSQTTDGAKPSGQVYSIGKDVSGPKLISSVQPEFPKSEGKSKKKLEGISVIGLVVDETGAVRDVHVVRSFRPDFDAKAMEAVKQYRFTPGSKAGEPVAVALKVEVNFQRF